MSVQSVNKIQLTLTGFAEIVRGRWEDIFSDCYYTILSIITIIEIIRSRRKSSSSSSCSSSSRVVVE